MQAPQAALSTELGAFITPQIRGRKEARLLIERAVNDRYAGARKNAGFWPRLAIWIKIQREIAGELKRKFPPHALYAGCVAR